MKNHCCRKFLFFIPFIILAVLALFTFAVFGLWNGVLTDVLGVKAITYWQALGLLVLAKILFGGFPGRRGGGFGPPWKRRMMMERWQSMTPEEREELRKRYGSWCDAGHSEEKGPEEPPKH